MLSMEMTEKIRYMYEKQGMTMEQIAQALCYSRKTVSKYINGAIPQYHRSTETKRPLKDAIYPFIDAWITEDKAVHRKQRRTAKRMFEVLRQHYEYQGSYDTVKELVREIRGITKDVFVPREHRPGEYCEFDFGELYIKVNGIPVKVYLHAFQFTYSNDIYGYISCRATQEEMFESHKRSFVHFEGIAHHIRYDNMSLAVKKILKGSAREETDGFIKFKNQFGFESEFCAPAAGNQKGDVEGAVGYIRRNFFAPMPEIASWDELDQLNETLAAWCKSLRETRKVYGTDKLIGELAGLDREALLFLPEKLPEVGKLLTAKANQYSLVPVDCVFYSVPVKYAYQQVDIVLSAREVVLYVKDQEIARHTRSFARGEQRFDPLHYLELFRKKPYTLINSKPIAQLPSCFRRFFERARGRGRGYISESLSILNLLRDYPRHEVSDAIELAMAYDAYTADGVKNLLYQLTTSEPTFKKLETFRRKNLAHITVQKMDIQQYNTLYEQEGSHHV
jgi:transposase